jgi:hypothetical protein
MTTQGGVSRAVAATVLAVAIGLSLPAYANSYTFTTPAGATSQGQPVSAEAVFTTSSNTVTLQLINLLANPVSVSSLISDIFFTAGGLTSGTGFYSPAASYINVSPGGEAAAGSLNPNGWELTNGLGTYHLNVLCGLPCSTPQGLIIGPGPYSNANASITGPGRGRFPLGQHNPFIDQTATFTLALTGATSDTVISNVVFSFGTEAGQDVLGIPIPAAVWLFGSGLFALIGIARRKQGFVSASSVTA